MRRLSSAAEVNMARDRDAAPGLPTGSEPQETTIPAQPAAPPPEAQKAQKGAGRQRTTADSFTGRAGQFAVMSELMRLRCNAAVPEVDLGTDVFAFRDDRQEVVRIQVKACLTPHDYADGSGYSAKFGLPMRQFQRLDDQPPLYYALAVWGGSRWVDFLIVSRARLQGYFYGKTKFGYHNKHSDDLEITLELRGKVECSGQDLSDCRNAWGSLPPLQPPPDMEKAVEEQGEGEEQATGGPAGTDEPAAGPDQV
jgi:hypothetical protein